MVVKIRNGINHVILHLLLKCKYRVRRRPQAVRCIVAAETLCIKMGLIFYGKRHIDSRTRCCSDDKAREAMRLDG